MVKIMRKIICFALLLACLAVAPARDAGREAQVLLDRGLEAVGQAASRQELKAAVSGLEQAKALAPQWPDIHYVLGRIYERLEICDKAIAYFEGYLELAPYAPDRDEVNGRILACRAGQERVEAIKARMVDGRAWTKVRHLPPVKFSPPLVSTRFRVKRDGRMEAQHPYLEIFAKPRPGAVREKWSLVEFAGRFFTYRYSVYFDSQDPPGRVSHQLLTVRGEVIPGNPGAVNQVLYSKVEGQDEESLHGEVLHELR